MRCNAHCRGPSSDDARDDDAKAGMYATSDLVPLLAERGVALSATQVYRLVTGTPERLSLRTLVALCDILGCTPTDLIEAVEEKQAQRATGTEPVGSAGDVDAASMKKRTPRRAEISRKK